MFWSDDFVVFTEGPALRGAALCRLVRPRAVRATLLGMTGCIPRGFPLAGYGESRSPSPEGPEGARARRSRRTARTSRKGVGLCGAGLGDATLLTKLKEPRGAHWMSSRLRAAENSNL